MTKKPILCFLIAFAFLLSINLFAQKAEYKAVFTPPVNIPIYLSGSFGELRSNHFHAGIDIKTQGVEGLDVLAIEDGYVSRIKISSGGYGKAIYITHPNGYVSVYAHLKKFNKNIQHFVKELQYKKERFAVETFPKKGELIIKKGEVIAFSGNTGSSSGPHLHFEIREEATQFPINPLFFNSIHVKDEISPRIEELGIYPLNEQTLINGKNDTAYFTVEKRGGKYGLSSKKKISISGEFSLGIRTYDQMNNISNKNGIYQIELSLDNEEVYVLEMDRLSFSTVRYINSLIDYNYYKTKKRRLIRTQIDTNNRIFNYRDVKNNGIFSFSDSLIHNFEWKVSDSYHNSALFDFEVQASNLKLENTEVEKIESNGTFFHFAKENQVSDKGIRLSFPANAFYRSFYFDLNILAGTRDTYAPIFEVHNKYTAVQKHFSIYLLPDSVPEQLQSKMYLGIIDTDGENFFVDSQWNGEYIGGKSRLLGKYCIFIDSLPPQVKAINFHDGKDVSKQQSLKVSIKDKQTGIKYYRGELNGKWILMEYEPKKKTLTYSFDDRIVDGENKLKVTVKDLLDNETVLKVKILR